MHETESAIRQKAYEIWLAEGRPAGREIVHWLRAEQEVSRSKPMAAKPRRGAGAPRLRKARA
jgi:hypothetical protein